LGAVSTVGEGSTGVFLRVFKAHRFLPPYLLFRLKISIPRIVEFKINLIALVGSRVRFLASP